MNILSLTAGAASMYCGSCLRDNALATELIARGHDVMLLPVYTPTLTDEPNVSKGRVFFGGISVYLQQHVPFFRWTPAFLDKLWDSGAIINMFAKRSIQVDARMLGEMTVSMLKGEHGHQRKELDKMIAWLRTQPAPDVINLPFTLLIGLARPLREAFGVPICCTLQGEDLFLDQLHEPYKNESLRLIRQQVKEIDRFVAVSDYYANTWPGICRFRPIASARCRSASICATTKVRARRRAVVGRRRRLAREGVRTRCRGGRSPSAISRGLRRRRGSTSWRRRIACCARNAGCRRRDWKWRVIWAAISANISIASS